MSILVVDDDPDIRELYSDALTDLGYTVHTAAHGGQALAEMRSRAPNMVILDLMMPVMDGWTVLREMQADPSLASVPVCVVSAAPMRAPTSAACVLRKPVELDKLVTTIEEHRCR